ncbi:MAG: hypothetical protein WCT16_01380 [Candidatus Buchananbacteria bacterium]
MERINYKELIEKYPWVVEKDHDCILSPDSDGLLCGLFMAHYLNWKIRGYYDGKVLIVDKGVDLRECVFLDMEIFRKEIRSVGHHMVLYNKNKKPESWHNFENCVQPNNLRDYDGAKNFPLKYPLATIHLLIGILNSKFSIDISESAICPLLYTDGVFKNLFGYPENCLDWLNYLGANNKETALHQIFHNDYYSIHDLMDALKDFFEKISNIGEGKRGNDKIKISNTKSELVNLEKSEDCYFINNEAKIKATKFIMILSELTGWKYKENHWLWSGFKVIKFEKSKIKPNNKNFEFLLSKNPLSWAMTSGLDIEYTLDPDNLLLK